MIRGFDVSTGTTMKGRTIEEFGPRLQRIRKSRGMSQEALAEKLGVSRRVVVYYEDESAQPPGPMLVDLARVLHVSLEELLGVKRLKEEERDREDQRLWKKFRQVRMLPLKDQRAILRVVNTMIIAKGNGVHGSRRQQAGSG